MNAILETRSLTKRFDSTPALASVNLALPPGRIAGLVGRNGAGKTTLLHHFVGLLLPTAGECLTLGVPARALGAPELSQMGFVPQEIRLIEWMTVQQHLRYLASFYQHWDQARVGRLLRELELPLHPMVGTLSPGDRQKVCVISAVGHHPKLLLLDEPFSALDPIVRERMLTLLIELTREDGSTTVISSHILHDVEKVVDWIICLHQGRLAANAPLDELQEKFTEWTVTARTGSLPTRFAEPYVLTQEGDGRCARLQVHDAARYEGEFRARHDVELATRPLNLEQFFPLLLRNGDRRP